MIKNYGGILKEKYPEADWKGAMGFRDIIAHQYFQVDHEEIFSIVKNELGPLIAVVEKFIKEAE